MKKVLLGILGALTLAIAVILGLASAKPATFRIERKADMAAPVDAVFAQLNDFHRWQAWSPWEGLDPNLSRQYSGPAQGVGAVYEWQGNKDVGKGRMTITQSRPTELVAINLEFLEPFEAKNQTTFELKPSGKGTEVSWAMTGDNSFMGKVMSIFVDMDSMVGADFERGLSGLERAAQRPNAQQL